MTRELVSSASSESLWSRIQRTYEIAQEKGAIYQIHSKPEPLPDEVLGLEFVLHVADALRDKPKPDTKRCRLFCSIACLPLDQW